MSIKNKEKMETQVPSKKDLKEGIHYYFNENGYMVFTEIYHKQRGYCCGNGCKHCPFDTKM